MQLNETIYFPVIFQDSTGALAAPSVGPTFVLRKNGSIVVGSTDVVISGSDGAYLYAFTSNSANFALGDSWSIKATGTVGGIALEWPVAAGMMRADYATLLNT